jgi:hypothetical protein
MRVLAAGVVVAGSLAAAPAHASNGGIAVVVVPPFPLERYADRGAVGLLVPGAGATVTREGALAALERGRVKSSLLGGVPSGPPLIRLDRRPGRITFYVSLPPAGRSHNVRRYPVAVVGEGYHGLLRSDATRIDGLLSVADIAPAVIALREGRRAEVRSVAAPDAPERLHDLDQRLADAHDSRLAATLVLAGLAVAFGLIALRIRSPLFARAAVLVPVAVLAGSLLLSAVDIAAPWAVVALVVLAGLIALDVAHLVGTGRWLAAPLIGLLTAFALVLAAWPEVNSLSSIGPHPDGGGRFYGITNQVETILLAPALVAGAVLAPVGLVPVGLLAVVTVGGSRLGADGGGAVVLAVGFLTLGARLLGLRLTPRTLAAIAGTALVAVLLFVLIDAATGGSSHVTNAVVHDPGDLLGTAAHRVHVSAAGAVASIGAVLIVVAAIAALAWLATRRPRDAVLDALLVALAASLVVNDTPTDVLAFGAIGALGVYAWAAVARTPRATLRSPPSSLKEPETR